MRALYTLLLFLSCCLSLSAQPRELLYVHTDRTLYQPGDIVWLRAYLTDPDLSLTGPASDVVTLQLLDPGGTVIQSENLYRGKAGHDGYLRLHNQLKGGRYTLRAYTNWLGNFGKEALFTKYLYLQELASPSLLLELEPERESFAPGTTVAYTLTARGRTGEPLARQQVTATLRIDGRPTAELSFLTDSDGVADLRLPLPEDLTSDDVILSANLRHKGEVESVLRPVRVSLGYVDIRFFPEGGSRSASLHKIAFRATDRHGKPLDVSGRVVSGGAVFSDFQSIHNGYGHFMLPPNGESPAEVRLDGFPDTVFRLPEPMLRAVTASAEVSDSSVTLDVSGNHGAPFFGLTISREDDVVAVQQVMNGRTNISLRGFPAGIYQLSLRDETTRLRWERLFFHRPAKVKMTDLGEARGSDHRTHEFKLRNALGEDVSGAFSVAIVDDGPYTRQNDKQPHLVAQLLLQSNLRGTLYEPNDYFDAEQPDAIAALDDVLLCHGWRTYAETDRSNFAYAPLRTGIHGFVSKSYGYNYNPKNSNRHLRLNGEKLKRDSTGYYLHPIACFADFRLSPGPRRYRYSVDYDLNKTGVFNEIVRVLPHENVFTPKKNNVQRRRTSKIPTTTSDKQRMIDVDFSELSGSSNGVDLLDEVVVVGYSQAMKATVSGVVVTEESGGDRRNYNIREYEPKMDKQSFWFTPLQAKMNLQPKYAYGENITFGYSAQSGEKPPSLLYWNAGLEASKKGYEIEHRAPQQSATYRIILEGITDDRVPVHIEETFSVKALWEFNASLPVNAVEGDTLVLTGTVVNNGADTLKLRGEITVSQRLALLESGARDLVVAPGSALPVQRRLLVRGDDGLAPVRWQMQGADNKPRFVNSTLHLRPRLFTHLSVAASAGARELEVALDPDAFVGPVTAEINLYGSPLDEIVDAYAGMLREPHGCFEQVTSTAYPNALIVGILAEQGSEKHQQLLRKSRSFLASGYRQLSNYEQPGGGFGLWKKGPAKPRYSAMALLQFSDLVEVWDGVDAAMINRTRRYLRNHLFDVGFRSGPAQLYQVLALTTYGEPELDYFITRHAKAVTELPDEHFYQLLLAQAYLATGDTMRARTQVRSLVPAVTGQTLNPKSINAGVGSAYGRFSQVEMLGYFIESYLATEGYDGIVEQAFSWATKLKSLRYQPTQAKIRHLRALRALATYRPPPEAGFIEVFVNDARTDTVRYLPGESKTIRLDLTPHVEDGDNRVRLRFGQRDHYPALRWLATWKRELPPADNETPLTLHWRVDSNAHTGDVVSYRLELRNDTDGKVRNPMLRVGLPGNAELLLKDLDPLIDQGIIDYYELDGAYLNLYLEELAANTRLTIPLDMTARHAGTFHAPPTVCYPYYQPHLRFFRKGVRLRVLP